MAIMTRKEQREMLEEGHTEKCVAYWRDVMTADTLGERWDHWLVPTCPVCDMRRSVNEIFRGGA
jgi:hypothetical protein